MQNLLSPSLLFKNKYYDIQNHNFACGFVSLDNFVFQTERITKAGILSENFLILRRNKRGIVINVKTYSFKVSVILVIL